MPLCPAPSGLHLAQGVPEGDADDGHTERAAGHRHALRQDGRPEVGQDRHRPPRQEGERAVGERAVGERAVGERAGVGGTTVGVGTLRGQGAGDGAGK
eukprot:2347416-Prymnesium_polylepis.1